MFSERAAWKSGMFFAMDYGVAVERLLSFAKGFRERHA
jgi:hypothetical protein